MLFRFSLYGFLKNLRLFEPFLILFFRDATMSFFQIGVLYAARDIATNLLEIPAGVFADVFGRRRSMVLSFSAYIISFVMFFTWPGFGPFIVAMIVFGLGESLRSGTHKALILEHLRLRDLEHLKVPYYGTTRAASQIGSALNALIAAGLVFYTGDYRYVFLVSILPYTLDLINLATYPKSLDGDLQTLVWHEIPDQIKATTTTFLGLFRNPGALRAIFNSSGFDAFYKATKDYLQPILETFALSLPILVALQDDRRSSLVIGGVYFVIFLLSSYASRHAGAVSGRIGNVGQAINRTFFLGAGLLGVAGIAAWADIPALSILVFLGLYLLHNVRKPLNVAYISDQIENQVMASGLSVESQLVTLLGVIIAPVLGALTDAFGVGVALAALALSMVGLAVAARVAE
ncbi:MAG: MFS transporter [Chloroflexi bacterium]|nr:MFS transporter [Chloroflexota bacterium]